MRKILQVYHDEKYEIFGENDRFVVKDKLLTKYYRVSFSDIEKLPLSFSTRLEGISRTSFTIFLIGFLLMELLNVWIALYQLVADVQEADFILSLVIYLPLFIIFHEMGHILCFKTFGRNIDKFGFKLNYIFPSFYVRMNDTYMLSKKERIIVHSGGLVFSLLMNSSLFLLGIVTSSDLFIYLSKYMAVDIILNTIPLLNSDGYKICLAIRDVVETKDFSENMMLVKYIKILNILFVIIYTIWFIGEL